ncbi:MAG: helicase-associated domain-containing protein [Hamadaea sp.]|uniref:helicase-associated domain-containing protein n=1 Tax=Hamadaea sp. TaxID=2024425 RepID=UPI0017D0DB9A|nr:helicase-associated domain-containing protein [Hamadaea sp.]NUR70741.1 helicase-associated domain-containing protein [Hamadaea sp.]NUT23945.1 helicase-associated domain-containing protein [Hamadaea sp.]
MTDDVLLHWLTEMDRDRLAGLLRGRPGLLGLDPSGAVASLTELAGRLAEPESASEALAGMPTPVLQVAEAAAVLGPAPVGRDRLAALLGLAEHDAGLDLALGRLEQIGVLVPCGGMLLAPADLRLVFREPLRLGPPAAEVLHPLTAPQLTAIAHALGLPSARRTRADTMASLLDFFADADRVRGLVAQAPETTRMLLEGIAVRGVHPPFGVLLDAYATAANEVIWAEERGLLTRLHGWGYAMQMPSEVGLALRGHDYQAPFSAEPPPVSTVEIPSGLAERSAAAALTAAVDRVVGIVAACDQQPVALLKAGGVGVREIRRLAKRLEVPEQQARLWLEIAGELGLVLAMDAAEAAVLVTEEFDTFRRLPPAEQADRIVHAWLAAGALPTWVPPEGRQEPPLSYFAGGPLPALRLTVLGVAGQTLVGSAGEPRGLSDFADLAEAVRWFAPVLSTDLADGVLESLWSEAELLGLVAHNAPTTVGLAVLATAEPDCPVRIAAEHLLSPATAAGIFQADLTVVVPGSPSAALVDLLDSTAEREGRGAASVWRFSAGSVRRALDGGMSPEELEKALTEVSQSGELPQPLRYLISDLARQHGAVRVRAAGCVIRSSDDALLAEVAATSRLRDLGLWQPAEGVLISSAAAEETLRRLREAGFAPVEEGDHGEVMVSRRPVRRAATPERLAASALELPEMVSWSLADPEELAERLLTQPSTGSVEGHRHQGRRPQADDLAEIDYLERLFRME